MIAIIDYGAGNLRSAANAIAKLGYQPMVTANPGDVLGADAVILPGVGAAADTVHSLEESGMTKVIRQLILEDRPLLYPGYGFIYIVFGYRIEKRLLVSTYVSGCEKGV